MMGSLAQEQLSSSHDTRVTVAMATHCGKNNAFIRLKNTAFCKNIGKTSEREIFNATLKVHHKELQKTARIRIP
jgi:hypothetical protein